MLSVAILVTVLAAEPRLPRMSHPTPPETFNLQDWLYAGDFPIQECGGKIGGGEIVFRRPANMYTRVSTTPDDWDKVVTFYRKRVGVEGENDSRDNAECLLDSMNRPVRLAILGRRYGWVSVTVVVSRAQGEKFTHIDLVYHEPLH